MNLTPKTINALVNIKRELLSREEEETVIITPAPVQKQRTSTRMRHARPSNAFQRSCQRKDWSSPVY